LSPGGLTTSATRLPGGHVAELQAAQVNAIDDGRPIGHLDLQLLWPWRALMLRGELRDDGAR
jgi:hypothetical protein